MTSTQTHTESHTPARAQLPLTTEGVAQFMKRLRADDVLKRDVIRLIDSEGSLAMIKKYFTPNGKQQKTIAAATKIMNAALSEALGTGGNITLSQSVTESPGIHVGVITFPDGTTEVDIECEL